MNEKTGIMKWRHEESSLDGAVFGANFCDGITAKYRFTPLASGSPDGQSRSHQTPTQTNRASDRRFWLFSRGADFWFAGGGASVSLLAAIGLVVIHGDRELDALDLVLSEFHLGATYGAIIQRRLWRYLRIDVLFIPLVILALTYALCWSGQAILLTSITMYVAVWHRGRQSLGVACFYQRQIGGPVSRAHNILFRGAIYLPMLAAMLTYTHLAPAKYEGQPYLAVGVGAELTSIIGLAALGCVIAYLALALLRSRIQYPTDGPGAAMTRIHPGEWWVVIAHGVAFGSAYVLGASNLSFALVLAIHHEVQYLYFTYAMTRRTADCNEPTVTSRDLSKASHNSVWRSELKAVLNYLVWPIGGFAGAITGTWLDLKWLAPLGVGGLFCHYWLDGRIWTRRSFHS
jgi:hypothetical protein